eukprot:CAMPEP_0194157864 /NCGR_PEP_ID=MMETSP0152-20130528/73653_1 /TAXON_ID=1049557 /ORGANISM="Thalassiothrix antarctica, Strain L6-D1" /LENGTH=55 /DNA_ID=CAMNT_0038866597 /DNA_START=403 /DNA_END=567 /DNA_ORIENTATION=+
MASSSLRDSSAASRPTLGLPPAPNPLVIFHPISSLSFDNDVPSACASVLMDQNDT